MRNALVLLALLMMAPLAQAKTITVTDKELTARVFPDETTQTYSFSLRPPVFELTDAVNETNKSVWQAVIKGKVIEQESGPLTATNHYRFKVLYNDTRNVQLDVRYERLGTFRWRHTYEFSKDNVHICSREFVGFSGPSGLPQQEPYFVFSYGLHGHHGTNPSLQITWGAGAIQRSDFTYQFFTGGDRNTFTCDDPDSIGGGTQYAMQELTAPPEIVIETFDSQLYSHELVWQYDTKAGQIAQRDRFINQTDACSFRILGLVCVEDLSGITGGLLQIVGFVFEAAVSVVSIIIGFIPFGSEFYSLITLPFTALADAGALFASIILLDDPDATLGKLFWMHMVFVSTIAACNVAFGGGWETIVTWPFWVAYGIVYVIVILALAFFWIIPRLAIETVTKLTRG